GGVGITSGPATVQHHLYVEESSPSVQRNSFISGPAQPGGATCTDGRGAQLIGSSAQLINNFIVGPACTGGVNGGTTVGLERGAVRRSGDNSIPSALVHSNTIVAYAGTGTAPATQSGVRLTPLNGTGMSVTMGQFLNNIFFAGPGGARSFAFEEFAQQIDPASL